MNAPPRPFPKRRTRADHAAALTSVLIMRVKPYSARDLDSMARIHATTPEQIAAKLRELGRGHLIEAFGGGDA